MIIQEKKIVNKRKEEVNVTLENQSDAGEHLDRLTCSANDVPVFECYNKTLAIALTDAYIHFVESH